MLQTIRFRRILPRGNRSRFVKSLKKYVATMAFPAAVTAIPGFLLVRDLGLLNTLAALVLPTVASGMSIFILKGFFDALPRELRHRRAQHAVKVHHALADIQIQQLA